MADDNPDMGRTGRNDNQNQNQLLINNTDKSVGRNKAIHGHIFDRTLFVQDVQYWKTLKEMTEYAGTDFNSNVRKSI